jgi:CDP-6-deoxy-D-xylo-4-hexulose-3-dehydrase
LFVNVGYNLRPTEIQGAFGIHQLGKLERFIEIRREHAQYWHEHLGRLPHLLVHQEATGTRHVWFGYPIILHSGATFERKELVNSLEAWGVETRPIMAGNISEQPGMQLYPHRIVGDLPNARYIHRNAFLFGNHQGISRGAREAVAGRIEQFLSERTDA